MSNTSYTDKQLFQLIAEGDEAAFEELFHAYVPQLHKVIMKIIKSETAVKDVIQEVFLYLWIDRERLAAIETPQNWIFKIAYNRSYSFLARQASLEERDRNLMEHSKEIENNDLENTLAFNETSRFIQQAIQLLPNQAKKMFQLSREKGLKAAEIAEQLGVSVQTVRNSLVRSSKSIKEYLAEQGIILPLLLIHYLF